MKKIISLITLTCISFSFFSQVKNNEPRYYPFPVSVLFGTKLLETSNLRTSGSINLVGLCVSEQFNINLRNKIQNHFYYSQVLAQQIIINDSVKANLKGFQIGLGLFGFQLFKRLKNANVSLTLGFNTGRFKLAGNENVMQHNDFFSPKITLKPWFRIKRFFIGAIIDYEYDVSNTSWKKTKGAMTEQLQLKKLSQTGITLQLNLGYTLKIKSEKDRKIAKNKKNNKKKNK